MAEQTLSELVMNLINWIESLHEKNLKYEAQLETLTRDLENAQKSNEQLEARLTAYQTTTSDTVKPSPNIVATNPSNITTVPVANHLAQQINTNILPHQQTIYQPIAAAPTFAQQPTQYVWSTYDTSAHDGVQTVSYGYDPYGPPTFQQQ